ncbi:ParB/RepB/Spo0J family partition protein [Pelotomaculum propionicicum]|uniref:Putative chromosome-partitioning protein ParB n=1 Tax=Pelotomaculum propionicicum TaxID=258475 RepID=A0A4Y7RXR0_9FIRM|nr:ParB/RepB/Spo0J family partition protein [Pelotomaculum propionicicum]NLI14531.1 ParB/RepB/Spo0J family partition protein [Peptococcaceae bacterium]TEB13701.1 putative chromosome-partitioning protein ParB [Pelotomaculum propionicicum]
MSKRRGLGKGLEALIPVVTETVKGKDILKEIDIEKIRTAPRQARKSIDQEKLEELASSIKEHGVIQPVVVRPREDGFYELIAGERRWRACKSLGYQNIPAVIKEYRDLEATAAALIENVQREDLNPLEEAAAYHQLMEDFDLTQEDVSSRVGKSRPFVANMVRLLGLPAEIKEMIAAGRISAGHARALLPINDSKKQVAAAFKIARLQLSVRQAEKMARDMIEEKEKRAGNRILRVHYLLKAEERLKRFIGAKVKVKELPGGRGKLEINFDDERDLKRIIDLLLGVRKG